MQQCTDHSSRTAQAEAEHVAQVHSVSDHAAQIQTLWRQELNAVCFQLKMFSG